MAQAMRAHQLFHQHGSSRGDCNYVTGRRAGVSTGEIGGVMGESRRDLEMIELQRRGFVEKSKDYGTSPKAYGQMLQAKRRKRGRR